ncbi:hypothetical protein [Archaeoglobus neptunius]|uniref:hypothetical protein n=1 Tax=Archaeoglobus neptunius TaxID=2798580 RepID=UPI001E491BA6|nr:hypothetical protein [Archaeoglobus neptunius]
MRETRKFLGLVPELKVNKGVLVDRVTGKVVATEDLDARVCSFIDRSVKEGIEALKNRAGTMTKLSVANIGVHLGAASNALQMEIRRFRISTKFYSGTDEVLEGMARGEVHIFPMCPVSTIAEHLDELKGMDVVIIPWDVCSPLLDSPHLTSGVEVYLPERNDVEFFYQQSPQRHNCMNMLGKVYRISPVEGDHATFTEFDPSRGYTFVSEVITGGCRNISDIMGIRHRELSYHERVFIVLTEDVAGCLNLRDLLVAIPKSKERLLKEDVHSYKACVDFVKRNFGSNSKSESPMKEYPPKI